MAIPVSFLRPAVPGLPDNRGLTAWPAPRELGDDAGARGVGQAGVDELQGRLDQVNPELVQALARWLTGAQEVSMRAPSGPTRRSRGPQRGTAADQERRRVRGREARRQARQASPRGTQPRRPGVRGPEPSAAGPAGQVPGPGASNRERLDYAMRRARELGLRITSTTGGRHAPNSYHYRGRAVDVAGSPERMAQFYREMRQLNPTELFYDPLGGIKHGREIGPIGGHRNHVHVAF